MDAGCWMLDAGCTTAKIRRHGKDEGWMPVTEEYSKKIYISECEYLFTCQPVSVVASGRNYSQGRSG